MATWTAQCLMRARSGRQQKKCKRPARVHSGPGKMQVRAVDFAAATRFLRSNTDHQHRPTKKSGPRQQLNTMRRAKPPMCRQIVSA